MISTTIKEATKDEHQMLEVEVIKRLKAIRSDADYAALLQYFYNYFSSIEKVITPFITNEVLADYEQRRNSRYIKDDIQNLGEALNENHSVALPVITSPLQAMAALYVMEGSIMGGKIIVQMLAKNGITKGTSFFEGYGAETGNMWSTFTAALNNQYQQEGDEKIASDTANQTFACFRALFQQN